MADSKRKTVNLYDINAKDVNNGYVNNAQLNQDSTTSTWGSAEISEYIPISGDTAYTFNGIGSYNSPCYTLYDENKQLIGAYKYNGRSTINFTSPNNARYFRFTHIKTSTKAMMVEGSYTSSTMPEFEPYWQHSLRKLTTSTDTITTLPTVIYPTGTTATVGLKGNTVQNGIPTPDNPVMPQGTGERTENLFDMSTVENGKGIAVDGSIINYEKRCSTLTPIDVSTYSNVTLAFTATLSRTRVIYALFNDSTLVTRQTAVYSGTMIDVSSGNKLYICFYDAGDTETVQKSDLSNVMLNSGSTPLPYEPYGYKIPISSGGVTTNIYLSEPLMKINTYDDIKTSTQEIRHIKKYVFTGTETEWEMGSSANWKRFSYPVPAVMESNTDIGVRSMCSHLAITYGGGTNDNPNTYTISGDFKFVLAFDSSYTTLEQFKNWLANQYGNGTPLTLWCVLINATTETVTAPSIPTTEGANSISVDTTVQPSEFTATWTGWHDASVKEKSENLFDTFDIVGQVPSISNGQLISYNGSTTSLIPIISGNITVTKPQTALLYLLLYAADMSYIGYVQNSTDANFYGSSVTGYENAKYCRLRIDRTTGLDDIQIMLNTGSTALPYEPYWQ